MTGSEHTTSALVSAALQQVGYQRPLPRDGCRLCPRQAYLTTRPLTTRLYYYYYRLKVPRYLGTMVRVQATRLPSLPTKPPDYSSKLLSCSCRKSHACTIRISSRITPHPTWAPAWDGLSLAHTRALPKAPQRASPGRKGEGGFRLPVSDCSVAG